MDRLGARGWECSDGLTDSGAGALAIGGCPAPFMTAMPMTSLYARGAARSAGQRRRDGGASGDERTKSTRDGATMRRRSNLARIGGDVPATQGSPEMRYTGRARLPDAARTAYVTRSPARWPAQNEIASEGGCAGQPGRRGVFRRVREGLRVCQAVLVGLAQPRSESIEACDCLSVPTSAVLVMRCTTGITDVPQSRGSLVRTAASRRRSLWS